MLIVLSPAKKLDYTPSAKTDTYTQPAFISHAARLIAILRQKSPAQIASLMKISDPLAVLNVARYAAWSPSFTTENAKQAILAFNGDVYEGLDATTLDETQLQYAQAHIRILSGLYGVLRPLDLMQPYRLEMGTRLVNAAGKDLYTFWGETITHALQEQMSATGAGALINLASEEYFKAVVPSLLDVPVITPVFMDWKDGRYKIISFYAKRARGQMARYVVENNLSQPQALKQFDVAGYAFDEQDSDSMRWVFKRKTLA